jgi:mono/diheme cytochrome c family protein
MTFFDPFYRALAALGFTDPVHPPLTHMPIGLVVAALTFGFGALLLGRPFLSQSARHCLVLAWLFFFPTVLLGFMDWQHYYRGVWVAPIIAKLVLAGFLFVVLTAGVILVWRGRGESRVLLLIYVLSFLAVVGLGYFGGRLVFGGAAAQPEASPAPDAALRAGEQVFATHCQACHAGGGNAILPQHPLKGSDDLAKFDTFLAFIRDPRLDNGSKGPMPAFSPQELPEPQARDLYHYLLRAFGPPQAGAGRPGP